MLSEEDKKWILERLEDHSRSFRKELEEHTRSFNERLERVETTLLTEFHKWASPQEMRQRTHAAAIRALDAEVALSDRLKNLEGR